MKSFFSFTLLLACCVVLSSSVSAQQKRHDELTFKTLNKFEKPNITTFTTKNGITFYLVEDNELPVITLSMTVRTGGILIPADKEGLAGITGSVMRTGGTKKYPADALNTLLEDKAASIETFIGFSSGGASLRSLKEDFNGLLPVLVDVIMNPEFPQDKIDLSIRQQKSGITRRNDDQSGIAGREFSRLIYGSDSPYTREVEFATLENIKREDLVAFHKEHFVGSNMLIGVIGDFKVRDMRKELERVFGSIPKGKATKLTYPKVEYTHKNTINFVNKSDVNQSYVLLGHIGGMMDNPDYAKLQVMNEVLSGGFSGRLFKKVRTDLGLAYSVFGNYGSGSNYPGTFTTGVMTRSETTAQAIDAIIAEVKRLQTEPVTQKELDDVKDQFLNSLVFRYDSRAKVLNQRIGYDYQGRDLDFFDKYVEALKKVTVADIQEVAKKYLRPDQMEILVVGNKAEIGDQLSKYGKVNEIDITIPMPGTTKPAVSGDAASGKALAMKMRKAMLGDATVSQVSYTTNETQYNAMIPGGKMSVESKATIELGANFKVNAETSAPQGVISYALDGSTGKMSFGGMERPLQGAQVTQVRAQFENLLVLVVNRAAELDVQFIGSETIDGKKYDKLSVKLAQHRVFYLNDKGLPEMVKYDQMNPMSGENMAITESYSDWKNVDGKFLPYAMVAKNGDALAQEIQYKVFTVK